MELVLYSNEINYCKYCINKDTKVCNRCLAYNDIIVQPTCFQIDKNCTADSNFILEYFNLLESYSNLLKTLFKNVKIKGDKI